MISDWLRQSIEEDRVDAENLDYISLGANEGAVIPNSHTVDNPIVMYEFIEEHRGEEISGSTIGIVNEWIVHNIAYDFGALLDHIGFSDAGKSIMDRGKTLDVGSTIYDDNHMPLSLLMWIGHFVVASPFAIYDILAEVCE